MKRALLAGAALIAMPLAFMTAVDAQSGDGSVFLGIRGASGSVGQRGAPVAEVVPGGTAAALGLVGGDLIVEANGTPVASTEQMLDVVRGLRPGDRLSLRVLRNGQSLTLSGVAHAASGASSAAAQPAVPAVAPISKDEVRRAAEEFARRLQDTYLDPAIGARYAETLRAGARSGKYDRARTAGELAALLTDEVQGVAPDVHLRLTPGDATSTGPQMRRMMPRGEPALRTQPAPIGPGQPIEAARWIAPGIGYMRFTLFPNDAATVAAAIAALDQLAEADTLIFDVRSHRGGGTLVMDAVFSYLFPKETVLLRTDARESVRRRFAEGISPTVRRVPGRPGVVTEEHLARPQAGERRLFDAKVYVLTSRGTVSAAEHFALALKATSRGVLIGETTRGAGNFALGGLQTIGEHFTAFIPAGRTYDPATGKGWEGTGIAPDIAVEPAAALSEALVRAGLGRAEAERLSAGIDSPQRASAVSTGQS